MPLFAFARSILGSRRARAETPHEAALVASADPDPFHALAPAERRLASLAVSLRGAGASELLGLCAGTRREPLCAAATVLASLERGRRRALISRELARELAPTHDTPALVRGLSNAPAWFKAHVCAELQAEVREALLTDPAVRRAWGQLPAHHPALARWAKRRLVSLGRGRVFRGGTAAVPEENTRNLRRAGPA